MLNVLRDPLLSQFDDSTSPDIAATMKALTLNDTDYVSIRKAERLYRSHESDWTNSDGERKVKSKEAQAKSTALRKQLLVLLISYFEKLDADTEAILAKLTAADLNRYKASSGLQHFHNIAYEYTFKYGKTIVRRALPNAATSRAAMNTSKLKLQCSKLKSELLKWTESNPLTTAAAATNTAVRLTSTPAVTSATLVHLYDPMNCENAAVALDNEKRLLTTSAAADITHNIPQALVNETYRMITQYQASAAYIRHTCNTNTAACRELLAELQARLSEES
jgi:hypothetical protein